MLKSLIGKWLNYAILAVIAVAIYRANGSNIPEIIRNIWHILDSAATALLNVWHTVLGSGNHTT